MKRVICLFLILMLLSINLITDSTYAENIQHNGVNQNKEIIFVVKDSDGSYVISNKTKTSIRAELTEYEGIYLTELGELISQNETNKLIFVDVVDLYLTDRLAVENIISNVNIENVIKEDILKISEQCIKTGNNDARVSLVIPKVSVNRAIFTNYYTCDGKNMKDYQIFFYNISQEMQEVTRGTLSQNIANGIVTFTMVGVGFSGLPGAIIASGMSLFEYFVNAIAGNIGSPSTSDYVQVGFSYDYFKKYTYCDIGMGYQLGLTSMKVHILRVDTRQQFFDDVRMLIE